MIFNPIYRRSLFLLLILSCLSLSLASPAAAAAKKTPEEILQTLVEAPILGEVFTAAQMGLLRTDNDLLMHQVLGQSPLLADVTPLLEEMISSGVESAVHMGLLGMTLTSEKQYPEIRKMAEENARALGYNEKQIKNLKVFVAMGPPNAYTMAYSKDATVLVIFTGLNNEANRDELRAIVGHEMGHVVSQHMLKGVKMMAMNMLVLKMLAGDMTEHKQVEEELLKATFRSLHMEEISGAGSSINQIQRQKRDLLVKAYKQLSQNLDESFQQSLPATLGLVDGYLEAIMTCLGRMEVPPVVLAVYDRMRANLGGPPIFNAQVVAEAMLLAVAADSREAETSSDLIGTTVAKNLNDVASVFLHFGASDRRTTVEDQIANAQAQIQEYYKTTPGAQRAEEIGGDPTASHPKPEVRALNILYYGRSVEITALKNPFLRLVALHDELLRQLSGLDGQLDQVKTQLAEIKKEASPEELTSLSADLVSGEKYLLSVKTDLLAAQSYLASAVIKLVNDSPLDSRNKLARDLVDYYLAKKQVILSRRDVALENAKGKKRSQAVRAGFQKKLLGLDNPILKQLELITTGAGVAANPLAHELYAQIAVIRNPSTDLKLIEKARLALRKAIPVENAAEESQTVSLKPPAEGTGSSLESRFATSESEGSTPPLPEEVSKTSARVHACQNAISRLGRL